MRVPDWQESDELDVECAIDNPSDAHLGPTQESGAQFIEFWVWHDGQLVPATAEELEWIREREREREARWRLRKWQEAQLQQSSSSPVQWMHARLERTLAALCARWQRQSAADATQDKLPLNESRNPGTKR